MVPQDHRLFPAPIAPPLKISTQLHATLEKLNLHYGRGRIVGYENVKVYNPLNIDGMIVCQLQYGQVKRSFRMEDSTVYCCKHQRKMEE
jgi:hypothetical protein